MNNMLSFPRLALTTMMVGLAVASFAQPSVQILSGPTTKTDMTAALSRGATMSQAVGPLFALDLDVLQAQAFNDKGVAAQRSMMSTVGASLKFTPFSPELQAVRPWAGAGLSWQTTKTHVDAKDANGSTYHLWNDGLLYDMAQPNPMPDIEFPSPLERDNVYETLVDQGARIAVPLKAGVDMQLTRRMHATVAVTAIPGAQGTWATAQAGIGFQLGRGKTYLKTLLPEAFLALGTDADGDGVKDTKDMCGGTEPGAIVDKHGCAIDTDADGVPDHRDLEINSPDLLVNDDGVSISLAEWKAMYAPEKGDPTTFVQDSATIISELTAAQMAQMLLNTGNTAAKAEQQLLHDLRERVYNPNVTYRVQYGAFLAAFAPSTDMYTHEAVQAIEGEHGLTLHVGKAYERLSEARNALAAAKAANHSDAFVTAYHNGVRVTLEEAAALEAMRNNSVAEAEEVFDVAAVKFHVQLGRYSAGVPVDVLNAFLQMGQIEQRMEADGTHRYLTAGVGAEETARQHLASAQDLGFDDAFLVAEQDGNAISVAQAREAMNQIEATLMAAK
jgi:hypothetical protein